MKPIMSNGKQKQESELSESQPSETDAKQQPLPEEAMQLIAACKAILYSDEMVEGFKKIIGNAKDFATAASLVCFSLLSKGQDRLELDLPPDLLYGDEGVSDHLLDAIYGYGQQIGVEEAKSQESYVSAMDIVEGFGMQLENAANVKQQPASQPTAQAPIMAR